MTDTSPPIDTTPVPPEVRLRLWPAVLIVAAHLSVSLYVLYFGATNLQSMVGFIAAPILALLLLLIWWLAASRAPWRDRIAGLVLTVAAFLWAYGTQRSNGHFLLMAFVPAYTTAMVAAVVLTWAVRWPLRRWVLAGAAVACALGSSAFRAESLTSTLTPVLAWRWTPTAEELLKAAPAPAPSGGIATLPGAAGPGDWPAFRGPYRDNRVEGVRFSTDWSTPPRELWRKRIGTGWSSYIAVGKYIFTQVQRDQQELVTCSRADTGAEVWANRLPQHYENDMGPGPRATPAFDRGRLFTLGPTGTLQCIDAANGKTIWSRDIKADAQTGTPTWGFASSPLVVGDKLAVFTHGGDGKSLIAYDLASGNPVWQTGRGGGGYSSPQLSTLCDTPQILMAGEFGLQSFAPDTGALLWERVVPKEMNPRCAQPLVADGNMVMLGSPAGVGARMFQIQKTEAGWSAEEQWTSRKFRPYFDDSVFHKGHIYGFDGDRLVCVVAATGEIRWEDKRYGGQLLLFPDMDMLLLVSEKGEALLITAAPDACRVVGRFKALSGKAWNYPVVAHGRLFVRNAEEAACFELPAAG